MSCEVCWRREGDFKWPLYSTLLPLSVSCHNVNRILSNAKRGRDWWAERKKKNNHSYHLAAKLSPKQILDHWGSACLGASSSSSTLVHNHKMKQTSLCRWQVGSLCLCSKRKLPLSPEWLRQRKIFTYLFLEQWINRISGIFSTFCIHQVNENRITPTNWNARKQSLAFALMPIIRGLSQRIHC